MQALGGLNIVAGKEALNRNNLYSWTKTFSMTQKEKEVSETSGVPGNSRQMRNIKQRLPGIFRVAKEGE